jgi:SAM-dependent methyltransferase
MNTELAGLLAEQRDYYHALAPDYLDQALDLPGGAELAGALDAFQPAGSVLEFACGPGVWTAQLLRTAADVTALDASPDMLALAAARNRDAGSRVRFAQADLFAWRPERRYDVVFMGFWLSHVPPARFESFWSLVADCLTPDGRVFFCDDAYRTADELIEGPDSATILRRVPGGDGYRIVKVPYRPADLEAQLRELGWDVAVRPALPSSPFYWGAGRRGTGRRGTGRRRAG